MESKMKIALCGGDARLLSAASLFAKNGYSCTVWKCAQGDCGTATRCHELRQAVDGIGAVILPVPAFTSAGRLTCTSEERTSIDAHTLFASLPPETQIYAGKAPELIRRIAGEYNLSLWDYAEQEEFSILNAVPTAEAAIQIAMSRLPVTVAGSRFIDLASAPGGFCEEARSILGDQLITALSLPGKYSPETAGEIIYKTVEGMLRENGGATS